MKLTPLDIQQHQFEIKRSKFYESAEVDSFLDMVKSDFEEALRLLDMQKERIQVLESELKELRANERILKEAIVSTQKVSEEIISNARKESDIILADARIEAEKIIESGRREIERLHDDIADLKRQRIKFEAELRALLNAHDQMLEVSSERMKEDDQEASKLKVFHPTK